MASPDAAPEGGGTRGPLVSTAAPIARALARTETPAEPPTGSATIVRAVTGGSRSSPGPEEVAVCDVCGLVSRPPVPPVCPACGGGYG